MMVENMAHSPLLVVRVVKGRVVSHVCQSLLLLSATPGMAEVETSKRVNSADSQTEGNVATFQRIPVEEAQKVVMAPRRLAQSEYRQYVRELDASTAGRILLGGEDKPITV